MPNDVTNVMPKILARALLSLRQRVIMPRIVNNDYALEARQKGDVINIPIPAALVASDVTPAPTPPTPASSAPGNVQITLANWKFANFNLTDKELVQVDANDVYIPMQMGEAIKALANAVNVSVMAEYKGIYGYAGVPGTTPFVAGTLAEIATVRRVLNQQLCPKQDRRVVLDHISEANAIQAAPFRDASQSNDARVIMEGEIGHKIGMDWFADDHTPTHTSTVFSAGAATVNGAHSVGVSTVSIAKATGSTALVKGDILTLGTDPQTYVVTADVTLAVGNTNVGISPALVLSKAGGETVVNKTAPSSTNTSVQNLIFHRDAFAFASRPLLDVTSGLELGNRILSMPDPVSGIVLRLEVSRQFKQVVWELDILWGTKLVRPELACRLTA